MVPGFSGILTSQPARQIVPTNPPVRLAGLWDTPSQTTCRFARTDTFCTGVVLWCKDVYVCSDRYSPLGHEESRTPYPCGVCIGVSSPDDW
jgi:hypothetical protein